MFVVHQPPVPSPPLHPVQTNIYQTPEDPLPTSIDDQISELQRQIFQLRRQREVFDGVHIPMKSAKPTAPKPPAAPKPPVTTQDTTNPRPKPNQPTPAAPTDTGLVIEPRPEQTPAPSPEPRVTELEHPFSHVREATYVPPNTRNLGTKLPPREPGQAYRTLAPIQDPKVAADVFDRSLNAPLITLSSKELLAIAPDVRYKYREAVTPKRANPDPTTQLLLDSADLPFHNDETPDPSPPDRTSSLTDSTIVPDPYETYLSSLPPGERPKPFKVAAESHAIWSIAVKVDNQEVVECILDPGCQIVAMSDTVSHSLGIAYDPSIRIDMESANGTINQSLGIARNIPLQIGPITVHVQVHVIPSPAYDILLGRPFDVLTESLVKNFKNEDQTITVSCPNTGQKLTIPTLPRGPPRYRLTHGEHFLQN